MSQASQKGRNANTLSLSNPVKPSAKTKAERSSVDETEQNVKTKDVVVKDTKDSNNKAINDEKNSTKKDKPEKNEEKNEKSNGKGEDKIKNGSANNEEQISNGSHKKEENTTGGEEKKTRETRQKTTAAKDSKTENSEIVPSDSISNPEKNENTSEKPAANKEKEKDKDRETVKSNQKDKKQAKEEKTAVKDTPKKESKDAKSTLSQQTSTKDKDSKEKELPKSSKVDPTTKLSETAKSKMDTPKSKIETTSLKDQEKSETPKLSKPAEKLPEEDPNTSPAKVDKSKTDDSVVWDNEEMEPLMMQVDIDTKTPEKKSTPASTSTPTPVSRILRMRQGLLDRYDSSLSNFPLSVDDPKNNTSTCVNVSTITNPHSPDKSYGAKMRTVSGRRSTRPLVREVGIHNAYREHIKSQNDSFDASSGTINESNTSGYLDYSQRSMNSSSFMASTRKRYIEEQENMVEEVESPKRARLDVSGLLNLVASPVSMLRNRLARARIQCSTPNKYKDDVEIDTVSASCIDEAKEAAEEEQEQHDGEEAHEAINGEDDEEMKEVPLADTDEQKINTPDDNDIEVKILKQENKMESSSPFVPNDAIKRKWNCSLM